MKFYFKYLIIVFVCIASTAMSYGQCDLHTDPVFSDPNNPDGDWYSCPPTVVTSPGLGFPGNPNPIPLQDVVVVGTSTQDANSGYPTFPVIPTNVPPGWTIVVPNTTPTLPCHGDPMKSPKIAPSSAGNTNGGRFGYTRNGGTKFHDGTDISATPNSTLYSMYDGTVTDVRDSFQPGEYAVASYGNYIEIESTVNGVTVYLKYNHLNGVGQNITVGTKVTQGQVIGITGTTGNAADPHVINKHLHIQAKDADRQKEDPENFIGTKFDKTTGAVISSPC